MKKPVPLSLKCFLAFVFGLWLGAGVLIFGAATPASDCQYVMQQLFAAQQDLASQYDIIYDLSAYIEGPQYTASTDAWMWDALDNATYALGGMQNTVNSFAEQAHAQHCY